MLFKFGNESLSGFVSVMMVGLFVQRCDQRERSYTVTSAKVSIMCVYAHAVWGGGGGVVFRMCVFCGGIRVVLAYNF